MNILFFGDVVGQPGCDKLRRELPRLRRAYDAGIVIANGENSAEGNGITPHSAQHLDRQPCAAPPRNLSEARRAKRNYTAGKLSSFRAGRRLVPL